MKSWNVLLLGTSLATGGMAAGAFGAEVVVYHTWSTPSEVAALKVLNEAFSARGHVWKDLAIAPDSGVNVSVINMITGGNPPAVMMTSDPGIYRDIKAMGIDVPLTELFEKNGAAAAFPPAVLKNVTVDGEIMKAPVAVHIDGMVKYNNQVADDEVVDPTYRS